MSRKAEAEAGPLCGGCVYYPPNLPRHAYGAADWQELKALACAYECQPGSDCCQRHRKTHCELVDLRDLGGGMSQ